MHAVVGRPTLLLSFTALAAGSLWLTPVARGFPPAIPLALWQRVLKGEDAKRVEELGKKIDELRLAAKYAEAQEPARAILQIRRRVQGEDHWETADARRVVQRLEHIARLPAQAQAELAQEMRLDAELGQLYQRGRFRDAVPVARRLLAIRQWQLGEEDDETAIWLGVLAFFLKESGNYAAAQPLFEKALRIFRTVLGDHHPTTARGYNNLASNLGGQARYTEAQPLFEKAVLISCKVRGENDRTTALYVANLADNLRAQGRYAEAQPLFEKVVQICRRALGEEDPYTAFMCNLMAVNLTSLGRYADAQPVLQKALQIRRTALGEDHPETAASYSNLAANLRAQGRYAEAQPLFEKALEITRMALGEDHRETALFWNNLAANLHDQGRYAEAQPLYERALRIWRKALSENDPHTALAYNNVAGNLKAQGRYAQAQPLFERALRIRCKLLGESHPDTANGYHNVAGNLQDQGRYAQAEPLYEKALRICRTALGEYHADTAGSYNRAADNSYAQGHYAEAADQWLKAATSFDRARLRSGAGGLGSASFNVGGSPWLASAGCNARLGRSSAAWRSLEAGLARGLLDDLTAGQASDFTPQEQNQRQQLTTRLDQLDQQIIATLASKGPRDEAEARFRELARQRQRAQDELARLAGDLSARQVYGLERVQAQVPADAALVAWVDVKAQPTAADPNGEHWACVLRHAGPPAWVKLPGGGEHGAWTTDDDELPERFRDSVSMPPGKDREDLAELTRRLAAQRLAPLAQQLGATADLPAVKHLLVVPVWGMAGVPVEALTDRYAVSYVSSGTLFARLAEQRREHAGKEDTPRLLAVGDPNFVRSSESKPLAPPPDHGVLLAGIIHR
jgi:tetratricopeptide (TPR) repeat protein